MAGILLALPTLSDGAVVTCDQSVAATMPLTNLWTQSPVEVARILATTGALTVDLGGAAAIRAALMLTNNVRDSATWTVSAATTEGGLASPSFTTGALPITDPLSPTLFASQSFRWWRIAINDSGNPDGYLDIPRLYLSTAWTPIDLASYSLRWEDGSVQRDTRGGQIAVAERPKRRVITFALGYQTEAEAWDQGYELLKYAGKSRDIIAVLDPANGDQVQRQGIYGLLTGQEAGIEHIVPADDPADALWNVGPFTLTELIR